MGEKRKKWMTIVVGVLVLLALGAVILYFSLGSIVKAGLTTVIPKITGTNFEVGSVSLSPLSGALIITNITLRNPEGFKSGSALSVGRVSVSIDTVSLFSDEVHMRSVRIEAPELTCEVGGSETNLGTILANVKKNTKGKETRTQTKQEAQPGKRFVVDTLDIVNGKAAMAATALGGNAVGAPIPDIHLKEIGRKGAGVDAGQLTDEILTPMLNSVSSSLGSLGNALKVQVDSLLEQDGKKGGGVLDAVKGLFK